MGAIRRILAAWMGILSFLALSALAEEAPLIDILAQASPAALTAPGETELTFTLTNAAGKLLESVCLSTEDGDEIDTLGDLESGGTQTFTRVHAVTEEELNAGRVRYIVTCVSGSEHFSYPVEIAVERFEAEPQVEFLRRVSARAVTDGGSVTVAYIVRNTGNVEITGLSLSDPLGGYEDQAELLAVGGQKVFLQRTALTEDAVSAPVLTYSVASSEQTYTASLEEMTFRAAWGGLDASITAGRSMFSTDTAEVILRLANSGTVDYLDITIYDDIYGGIVADSICLPAGGEPVELSRSYPIREDSSYRWRVVGVTSAGDRVDLVTNTEGVPMDEPVGDPLLTIRAVPAMTHIRRGGYVPVTLEIANLGETMAAAVKVSEVNQGELAELAVVPVGDATVLDALCEVRESTTLIFSAVYADRYGQQRTAASEPVDITVGAGGEIPVSMEPEGGIFGGATAQVGNPTLFMALLIGCCAAVVILAGILLVTSRRARMERRIRAEARKQRMARTAKFKPVRKKDEGKKQGG